MKDIQARLGAIFQAEHAEHVEHIRSILALADNLGEAGETAVLDEAFRRAHTLKGAARAVDLAAVEGLASGLESVFSRVREGALHLDRLVVAVIHRALDSSDECVAAFRDNRVADEPGEALDAIKALLASPGPGAAPALPAAPVVHHAIAVQPVEMVRLPGEDLDRLVRSSGRILTESLRQETITGRLGNLRRDMAEMNTEWSRFRAASAAHGASKNQRFSSLPRYIEFLEHKVRTLSAQAGTVRILQQQSAWNMQRAAEQLQRDVWTARMAPVEDLFEAFRKMVRDLARDQNKEIAFRLDGPGVRADRVVLQALKDPLMHLLRNAISHGIEAPAEREHKGKAPVGSVTLRIRSERGRLEIEVDDDGRGVDLNSVAKVAAARGLLADAAAPAHELERVIFQPGFSTSPTVNDLSGRGMGLSVVDETVRRLQGEVNLRRKTGPGASMALSVPLSVSSFHLLLVSSQGQTFGIPTHGIERLFRIEPERVETAAGAPVVNLNGRQTALFSLAHLLGIGDGAAAWGPFLLVVLLRSGTHYAAVVVDEFVAEKDALIQDLGFPCPASGNVSGGVLLREGTVCIVLNPVSLVEGCRQLRAPLITSAKKTAPSRAAGILVVDDSITARSLEKSILEANGYRVRAAVDGLEALQLARAEKPDLIISDIQMPRLDGFGLLAALKADPNLSRVPVIIVSSLESAEDQQRGLLGGADAYVVKRKFDQQELLDAIRQIL